MSPACLAHGASHRKTLRAVVVALVSRVERSPRALATGAIVVRSTRHPLTLRWLRGGHDNRRVMQVGLRHPLHVSFGDLFQLRLLLL